MAAATLLVGRKEKANFMTVMLEEEVYGEVYTNFYRKFQAELGPIWTLIDKTGKRHEVAFNMSTSEPRLTNRWMNLRRFYNLTGDHLVHLTYFGDNLFKIDVYPEEGLPHTFPSYHSKSTKGRPIYFDITLAEDNTTGSELTIKNEFANFVAKLGYQTVSVWAPYGNRLSYKHYRIPTKDTEVGNGLYRFHSTKQFWIREQTEIPISECGS